MTAEDVTSLLALWGASGIAVWLDGGWGVDALLGEQTRNHADVDMVVQNSDVARLVDLLVAHGYTPMQRDDTSSWNFVMADAEARQVDIHVIVFDEHGNGMYGPPERGVAYPAGSLNGTGTVSGQIVRCVTAEHQAQFHSGYKVDEDDFRDVLALHRRFGVAIPRDYERWTTTK